MSNKNKKPAKKSKVTSPIVKTIELVQIRWEDHFSGNAGWQSDWSQLRTSPMVNMTIGYKVHEDKKTITLAQNLTESLQCADTTTIIKSCILKQTPLGTIDYELKQ